MLVALIKHITQWWIIEFIFLLSYHTHLPEAQLLAIIEEDKIKNIDASQDSSEPRDDDNLNGWETNFDMLFKGHDFILQHAWSSTDESNSMIVHNEFVWKICSTKRVESDWIMHKFTHQHYHIWWKCNTRPNARRDDFQKQDQL